MQLWGGCGRTTLSHDTRRYSRKSRPDRNADFFPPLADTGPRHQRFDGKKQQDTCLRRRWNRVSSAGVQHNDYGSVGFYDVTRSTPTDFWGGRSMWRSPSSPELFRFFTFPNGVFEESHCTSYYTRDTDSPASQRSAADRRVLHCTEFEDRHVLFFLLLIVVTIRHTPWRHDGLFRVDFPWRRRTAAPRKQTRRDSTLNAIWRVWPRSCALNPTRIWIMISSNNSENKQRIPRPARLRPLETNRSLDLSTREV